MMWLLHAETLQLEEFFETNAPQYAILSHTWQEEEVTFQEMKSKQANGKIGYRKIKGCCTKAIEDGHRYVWVDTCCIDKTSSAELSEAINSMFRWYENAEVCYVYLTDVPSSFGIYDFENAFKKSRWFKRGWTLQELIAPVVVEFYACDWSAIGTKSNLIKQLAAVTGIDLEILDGAPLSNCNVAQRMSWAASRETTRVEDEAYSLLGIFQVNMPLLYGEGKRAFLRLQEEILKSCEDYTILARSVGLPATNPVHQRLDAGLEDITSALAASAHGFREVNGACFRYSDFVPVPRQTFTRRNSPSCSSIDGLASDDNPPMLTGRGLRISLPLSTLSAGIYLACIYCKLRSTNELICVALRRTQNNSDTFKRDLSGNRGLHLLSAEILPSFKPYTIYVDQQNPGANEKYRGGGLWVLMLGAEKTFCNGRDSLEEQNYDEAEKQFTQALKVVEKAVGYDHPKTLMCRSSLSTICKRQGRYLEAEELDIRQVYIRERRFGREDATTLASTAELASAISLQGRYGEAELMFLTAVDVSMKALGSQHPVTMIIVAKAASHPWNHRQLEAKDSSVGQSFKLFEAFLTDCFPYIPDTPVCEGWQERNPDRWELAEELLVEIEELLVEIVELYKKVRGAEDPATILAMSCLAAMYDRRSFCKKAIELQERVLEMRERILGAQHPHTHASRGQLAEFKVIRRGYRWSSFDTY